MQGTARSARQFGLLFFAEHQRTIVLELNHIKFELVPAYIPFSYSNGVYNIPNGPTEWIITKPNDFNDTLIKCNTFNNSMIKPIIRLIKRWNVTNNGRNMKSFVIEKKIAENMYFARYSCSNFTDYLKEAFTQIRDYLNYDEIAWNCQEMCSHRIPKI